MQLVFGMDLDDKIYPMDFDKADGQFSGTHYCGPFGLIQLLSKIAGINERNIDNPYLRMEQYRQLLQLHLNDQPDAFYAKSYEADGLGTAKVLLDWRDELVLAGWNFEIQDQTPNRLSSLARIEQLRDQLTKILDRGYADKVSEVLYEIQDMVDVFDAITLKEPLNLLPGYLQQLFYILAENDHPIQAPKVGFTSDIHDSEKTDLQLFQTVLSKSDQAQQLTAKGDGSLVLFDVDRDTDAAIFIAKMLQLNPQIRPLVFLPAKSRTLDHACMQEGLPSMGIQTESFARPSLQLLKLVGAFLWKPVDPYKIMEFVSLSIQPIWEELARLIAETLAERPGTGGEFWRARIAQFFRELEERYANGEELDIPAIKAEYQFWFGRPAYDAGTAIPKAEILSVFERLANWAGKAYDSGGSSQRSLKGLENQSRKIAQLIASLPESESAIDELRLERIVRTIYEASSVTFVEAQANHLPYVHKSGAILEPVETILWWNFNDNESDSQLPRWYRQEIEYLQSQGIQLDKQDQKIQLQIWQRQVPVMQAKSRLIMVMPKQIAGTEQHPHPLFGDLQACFENWETVVIKGLPKGQTTLIKGFKLPEWTELEYRPKDEVQTFLRL
ncbi:MAG: hypothetical protein AAF598_20535, partial [Bacteroidota bacterium]